MFESKFILLTILISLVAFIRLRFKDHDEEFQPLILTLKPLVGKLLVGFLSILFAYKTINLYILRQKYSHIPGPRTNGIIGFYLGNIPELQKLVKKKMVPDILADWVKEYGPCFKYQIFDKISIFTISPDAVKEMYIEKNFPKHPDIYSVLGFPYGSRYMGTSLVTSLDNVAHKRRRNIMNPAFSRQ